MSLARGSNIEVDKINEARIICLDESCIENNATKEIVYSPEVLDVL